MLVVAENKIFKFLSLTVVAVMVAFLLFVLMYMLIRPSDDLEKLDSTHTYLNFVRVDNSEDDLSTKKRRPPKEPPPPEKPPETPQMDQQIVDVSANLSMNMPSIGVPINSGDGPFLGTLSQGEGLAGFDTDVIPVVRVPPVYPRAAKQAKIQGFVTMEVTINPDGTVSGAKVIEAKPPRLFNQSAIAAIKRWKFRPKIENGAPQAQKAKQTIEFKLNK